MTDDVLVVLIIILVGFASFGLGRLSVVENNREVVQIEQSASVAQSTYVASKNGSVYHLPWCSGAQRISEKNKIFFNSKEEAERAGYRPAGNCKGI